MNMTAQQMIEFLRERVTENEAEANKWEAGTWLNGYYAGRASSYSFTIQLIENLEAK